MTTKSFKKLLRENRNILGTIIQNPRPEIAEIFSTIGYDWLFIDLEHGLISVQEAASIILGVDAHVPCVVRISSNEESKVKQVLDIGATGVVIPLIKTKEDAHKAVQYCKYPPEGIRSVGITRAQRYDLKFKEYMGSANSDIAVILQIEHIDAVNNFEKISSINGIDGIFVGPYDLSGSMGFPGEIDHPEVVEAIQHIIQLSESKGIARCIYSHTEQHLKNYLSNGYNVIALCTDHIMLSRIATQYHKQAQDLFKALGN